MSQELYVAGYIHVYMAVCYRIGVSVKCQLSVRHRIDVVA